jgi:hypothetical protein
MIAVRSNFFIVDLLWPIEFGVLDSQHELPVMVLLDGNQNYKATASHSEKLSALQLGNLQKKKRRGEVGLRAYQGISQSGCVRLF